MAVCERHDSSTPYFAARRLLRELIALPPEGSDEALTGLLLSELERRAPELQPWAPLIGMAIAVPVPETRVTRELEEEFRRPKLAEVVLQLLAHILPPTGLFTIEDAHLMDEASADLFSHLARALGSTSWLWCLTRRDVPTGFSAPDGSPRTRIELEPLSHEEAMELGLAAAREAPLAGRDLESLIDRSGGNPLFVRELIAAAVNGDAISDLPDSVEDVIVARIDHLSREDRHLLRRMSVLGQTFSRDLLTDVVDHVPAEEDPTWGRLEPFVGPGEFGSLAFRNALVRDCAYDGLSFRLRREIHSRVADTIRDAAEKSGRGQEGALSFHYLHAQRFAEAWIHSLRAAEQAKAVSANVEAADYYERALAAARRGAEVDPDEVSAVHEALADARNATGDYVGAASEYRSARRLAAHDRVAEARLLLKLAQVEGWLDRYTRALRWITRGLRNLEGVAGADAARQRAELLGWYGRFCQEGGRHQMAIKWCSQAVEQAEAAGDMATKAEALRIIDWAKMDLGQLQEPLNWLEALRLFEEMQNLPGQAGVLNMLGAFAYFKGDWTEAETLYRRAQATVQRTGNAVMDAFYVFNIGEIALDQGRLDEAERAFVAVRRTWRAAGYRSGVADAEGKLARVLAAQGRYEEAVPMFESAIAEMNDVGSRSDALEATARMAECMLLSGDSAGALAVTDRCLELSQSLGGLPPQAPLIYRVRGAALARRGEVAAAISALNDSLDAARRRDAEYEAALTLRVLSQFASALQVASEETLRKLKVTWMPSLIGPPTCAR